MRISAEIIQLLSILISGLFGAILGGLLSYIGSMRATRVQIDNLYKQEKERREWEGKEKEQEALRAFYIETKENIESINRWKKTHDFFRFGMEAWDSYKPVVKSLKPVISEKLIKTYSEVRRHNTSVDYHIELLASSGEGFMGLAEIQKKYALENGITEIETILKSVNQELVNTLDVVPPTTVNIR